MIHINSGCIGINITQNQDTAVPCPYNKSGAQETALPCPLYHSGAAGIDITSWIFVNPPSTND